MSTTFDLSGRSDPHLLALNCPGDCQRVGISIEATDAGLEKLRADAYIKRHEDPLLPTNAYYGALTPGGFGYYDDANCLVQGNADRAAPRRLRASLWRSGEVIFNGIDDMRAEVNGTHSTLDVHRDDVWIADHRDWWGNVDGLEGFPMAFDSSPDHGEPRTRITFCLKTSVDVTVTVTTLEAEDPFVHGENLTPVPIPDDGVAGVASPIALGDHGLAVVVHASGVIAHPAVTQLVAVLRNGTNEFPLTLTPAGAFDQTVSKAAGASTAGPWELVVADRLPGSTGQIEHWALDVQSVSEAARTSTDTIALTGYDASSVFGTFSHPALWTDAANIKQGIKHGIKVALAPASKPLVADFAIEVRDGISPSSPTVSFTAPDQVGSLSEGGLDGVRVVMIKRKWGSQAPLPATIELVFVQY